MLFLQGLHRSRKRLQKYESFLNRAKKNDFSFSRCRNVDVVKKNPNRNFRKDRKRPQFATSYRVFSIPSDSRGLFHFSQQFTYFHSSTQGYARSATGAPLIFEKATGSKVRAEDKSWRVFTMPSAGTVGCNPTTSCRGLSRMWRKSSGLLMEKQRTKW